MNIIKIVSTLCVCVTFITHITCNNVDLWQPVVQATGIRVGSDLL